MSPAVSLVLPAALFVSFNSAYASLVDTSQNQTFESRPQAAASSKRPVSSPFIKLAAVHFIANDGNLSFGNQEFLPEDICKQGGYTHKGCPAGYVKGEACPEDGSYVKDCIDPDTWCKNNGYEVTGCQVPQYPQGACPYGSGYYKSCETDNIRACKELGYSLTCEAGKVGDTNQSCPYNESYKKCVCNPCGGYDYTASEANAQGYTPGEVCNSCGTMKYKRSANACDGFKECTDGGAAGAEVCYSGSLKKFSECKEVCDPKFQYDSSNCTGDKVLTGNSCGGKYESCTSPCGSEYSYGKSNSYLAWGEECESKKKYVWNYTLSPWNYKGCTSSCQSVPIQFSYAGKNIALTLKYYEPTTAQKNSKETVVTTCKDFYEAMNNPNIFNVKISGHLTCSKQSDYMTAYVTRGDKHIYGNSKDTSSLTFTETLYNSQISATNLILSNLTIDVSKTESSPIFNVTSSDTVLDNVDIRAHAKFHESVFLKGGQNNFYIDTYVGYNECNETTTLVINTNASLSIIPNDKTKTNQLRYGSVFVLGNLSSSYNLFFGDLLFMQGNNKVYAGITLQNGSYLMTTKRSYCNYYHLTILGDNSLASGAMGDIAVGNNSTLTENSFNRIALGKNASVGGIRTSASYSGEYTNYTTKDYSVFY